MNERFGSLKAELAETADDLVTTELIRLINENIKPLQAVGPEDVCIRSMYIVSDQVNSYGGRFPAEEHDRLTALLVDSPVMVGHRKDSLPIGRNFHAVTVTREGRSWVRSYFYWLNSAEGAESLRENIDKGVYKECSIGFTYLLPECSICGEDIRRCRHNLFQSYADQGAEQSCHFNYRQIQKVLETSLVYRGATPDTAISKDLTTTGTESREIVSPRSELSTITQLSELESEATYLVVPHYEGLGVTVGTADNSIRICNFAGRELHVNGLEEEGVADLPEGEVSGKLVGYRGRERCSIAHLNSFLAGGRGPVTRVLLYLYPDDRLNLKRSDPRQSTIRLFRHGFATGRQLAETTRDLATKSGVEIWQVTSDGFLAAGVRFLPTSTQSDTEGESFGLALSADASVGELYVRQNKHDACFAIHNLNLHRLQHGGRFLSERVDLKNYAPAGCILSGRQVHRTESGGYRLRFDAPQAGELRLQPIRLHGRARYLAFVSTGGI